MKRRSGRALKDELLRTGSGSTPAQAPHEFTTRNVSEKRQNEVTRECEPVSRMEITHSFLILSQGCLRKFCQLAVGPDDDSPAWFRMLGRHSLLSGDCLGLGFGRALTKLSL